MNELFKNAAEIINAAASGNPLAFKAFIILVYFVAALVLYYIHSNQFIKDSINTAVCLLLLAIFTIILVFMLRLPLCWDGSSANPCPPPPPPPCWDGSRTNPCPKPWVSTQGFGEDKKGIKAKFNIYVLTTEYNWEVGTPNIDKPGRIRYNGELRELDLLSSLLHSEDMARVLKSADVIISFGTASCQGGNFDEENRALERASLIQTLIKEINNSRTNSPVYKRLNLGQFKSKNCGDPTSTAPQRSIIVVGADITRDRSVNVQQALHDFLKVLEEKEGALGKFKLTDYSRFDYMF